MLIPLEDPPSHIITRVIFGKTRNILASTSWDKSVKLYEVEDDNHGRKTRSYRDSSPVLDCTFFDSDRKLAFGNLAHQVNVMDAETGQVTLVGQHDAPVRCVEHHERLNVIITGSWDKKIRAFDPRCDSTKPVADVEIFGKVYCMDLLNNTIVVGDSMKRVYIYDISRGFSGFATPDTKDGILKFQYRSIKCFPDNRGFALGSIEGRVAWEYFSKAQEYVSQQYAFKCHRNRAPTDCDLAYAVNSIDFHPRYGTFVTGGADGVVCAWDGHSRKRLWRTTTLATSVASVSFNNTGEKLAIGISDIFQLEGHVSANPSIMVRSINPDECKPRKATS
ncbi:mitotic checkpoint BUB3 family protein [Babesia ovis]|uniref:Mitotic checkpoint BUB3 family protein n=1 Tax=Babesia ovis TaxID=5869 RepID=A0A9W5TBL2_BABOV|nr:mitotic checkpoint BUB3 family protein [Babesia ovis]